MLEKLVVSTLPLVPHPIMRRLAARYIAGETLEEALERVTQMAARGFPGAVDILGEHVTSEATARAAVASYREAATGIAARGLDAYISIKPTHVGLTISEDLALELYSEIAGHCADLDLFVRVEMEDSPTTDATLRLYRSLRERFDNVGIVLQSRLFRTLQDIADLPDDHLDVRMVKGIYLEPASIAHVDPKPIRQAFVEDCRALMERGAKVAFATHDAELGERLLRVVSELDYPRDRYEFQVLLGIQEPLWSRWQAGGHTVRVYVPYGPDWRAYTTRRLRRNPQIVRHLVRNTLRLG